MSGFDEEAFEDFMAADPGDAYKKAFSGGKRDFGYLKLSQLPNGSTVFRILPPMPEKNPNGFLMVATHMVSVELGAQKHPRVQCILRKTQRCYICDIMNQLAPSKKQLPNAIQEALMDMDSSKFKCIAYAVSIYAEPESDERGAPWRKSKTENGGLLQVYADGVNERIKDLMLSNKFLTHEEKGNYLCLKKNGNRYELDKAKDDEDNYLPREPIRSADILTKYRNTSVVNAFYKGTEQLTYDQQRAFLSKAWWMRDEAVVRALKGFDEPAEPMAVTAAKTAPVSFDDDEFAPFD